MRTTSTKVKTWVRAQGYIEMASNSRWCYTGKLLIQHSARTLFEATFCYGNALQVVEDISKNCNVLPPKISLLKVFRVLLHVNNFLRQ